MSRGAAGFKVKSACVHLLYAESKEGNQLDVIVDQEWPQALQNRSSAVNCRMSVC